MRSSIRTFLLLNLLLALTLTSLLTIIGSYYMDQREIYYDADSSLSQFGFLLQALATSNAQTSDYKTQKAQHRINKIPLQVSDFSKHMKALYSNSKYKERYQFQVWDNNDQLLLRSHNAPQTSLLSDKTGFSDTLINGIRWRTFTIRDPRENLNWAIAEHYDIRDRLLDYITLDDIYIMLLIYPLSGFLIWFIIGRGLRTIKRVTNEVAQRAADH